MPFYSADFKDGKVNRFNVSVRWGTERGSLGDMSTAEFEGSSTSRILTLETPANLHYADGIGTLRLEAVEYGPNFVSHADSVELRSAMTLSRPTYWRGVRRKYADSLSLSDQEPVGLIVPVTCGAPGKVHYRQIKDATGNCIREIFGGLDRLMGGFSKTLAPPSSDWKLDLSSVTPENLEAAAKSIFDAAIANRFIKLL